MNGAHKTIGRINRTCLREYTSVIKILKEHDGYVNVNTFEKFQMRKIFLKKINGKTTNEVFARLFRIHNAYIFKRIYILLGTRFSY